MDLAMAKRDGILHARHRDVPCHSLRAHAREHHASTGHQNERMDSALTEDESVLDDFVGKYTLRPQTRKTNQHYPSAWIDHDTTGDFDPNEEERKARNERHRARLHQRQGYVAALGDNGEVNPSERTTPAKSPKVITALKFPSESGRAALRACLGKPPSRSLLPHHDFSDGYRTRGRTKPSKLAPGNNVSDGALSSVLDLPIDLTGHPVARGCWGCLSLKIRCPLLDDERAWPCYTCMEDENDCELVTPAKHKRACEGCKRRRLTCSYTYTLEHSQPCQGCAGGGHACIAGPDKDLIPTRLRYDRDWVKDPLPPPKKPKKLKTYWTCTIGEDCTACEMASAICIPEQTTVPPQAALATPQKRGPVETQPEPPKKRARTEITLTADQTPTKQAKAGKTASVKSTAAHLSESPGITKTITTKLCHPITFNAVEAARALPCNFCDGSSTAILGLDAKEVEVIDWKDGRGLTEISGGHTADGHPSTRVCTTCTMQRMTTIMCAKHDLRPTRAARLKILDPDGAITTLFSGKVRAKDHWCSLCPALAMYECETPGAIDVYGDPSCGCGLQLCETCMLSLTGLYDGDLQEMLGELRDDFSDERPLGLRADWELLKEEGLLMRYVLGASQQLG
ncbi:hypothetical protein LTR53_015591 [Teratosphaeriaceae sp. CCFEE 6253]|nr:hypothetical protein LTR53_015591 [Teratosphaeriaceae sp. CCFEE 6253]